MKIFYNNSIEPQNDAMMDLKVISEKYKFHYEEFLSKKNPSKSERGFLACATLR